MKNVYILIHSQCWHSFIRGDVELLTDKLSDGIRQTINTAQTESQPYLDFSLIPDDQIVPLTEFVEQSLWNKQNS